MAKKVFTIEAPPEAADELIRFGFHNVRSWPKPYSNNVAFRLSPLAEHALGDDLLPKAQELVDGVFGKGQFEVQVKE